MIDKELSEIKKTLSVKKAAATSVKGCYINAEGRIITTFERSFGLIEEAEIEKYLAIFKRTLSGGLQKNLIDIAFSPEQVSEGEEYKLLNTLKKSSLEDGEALSTFYEKIASTVKSKDNYAVLLLFNSYDVPFKGRNDALAADIHEDGGLGEVYSYILCALCPVKAGKSALCYDPIEKTFTNSRGEGTVCAPTLGFLFPAFDGRQTNIHNALFYTRSTEELSEEFLSAIFGKTPLPMPAAEQFRSFRTVLAETLEEECSLHMAKEVRRKICERMEEHKDSRDPEPLALSKKEVRDMLLDCGVADEKMENFSKNYNDSFGPAADLTPKNIVDPKHFELRTPEVLIKVSPGHDELIDTKIIDGVKYILVRADGDVEFNGLSVKIRS